MSLARSSQRPLETAINSEKDVDIWVADAKDDDESMSTSGDASTGRGRERASRRRLILSFCGRDSVGISFEGDVSFLEVSSVRPKSEKPHNLEHHRFQKKHPVRAWALTDNGVDEKLLRYKNQLWIHKRVPCPADWARMRSRPGV